MATRILVLTGLLLAMISGPAAARDEPRPPASPGLERHDGLLPVWIDAAKGRILLSLPPADSDGVSGRFLYMTAVRTGLGSGDLPIDAGRTSRIKVLAFRRIADKVVAEYENTRFTARGASAPAQRAIRDSFAVSTAWIGKIDSVTPDGRLLVDISSFLTRDTEDIDGALRAGGQKG